MKLLLAMSPTIFFVVYAQLITKWRIGTLSVAIQNSPDKLSRLYIYLSDPLILSTYLAALAGGVAWVFVVEKFEIAVAFPIYVGLTVLVMAICGSLLFSEHIGVSRIFGMVLIVLGVAFVSRT